MSSGLAKCPQEGQSPGLDGKAVFATRMLVEGHRALVLYLEGYSPETLCQQRAREGGVLTRETTGHNPLLVNPPVSTAGKHQMNKPEMQGHQADQSQLLLFVWLRRAVTFLGGGAHQANV